ncbi:radical SAM protein [Serratia marcescens]|uniref:Radical SAM protein n=1 Tax=Serratia marcescens TaxID=615 RepID=A0A939SNI6_SERMA|nr:radical SAM protein [Serratia marcescens]
MIRFSVNIMRGCYGGCSFCSITEHEGRIIQSRSEDSIVREIEEIRDKVPGFTGVILDPAARPPTCICCAAPTARRADLPPRLVRILRSAPTWTPTTSRPSNCIAVRVRWRHQEDPDRFRGSLRSGGGRSALYQGAGDPPRRRLPEDRAGAHRRRAAVEDDEAGHGQLRSLQAAV